MKEIKTFQKVLAGVKETRDFLEDADKQLTKAEKEASSEQKKAIERAKGRISLALQSISISETAATLAVSYCDEAIAALTVVAETS